MKRTEIRDKETPVFIFLMWQGAAVSAALMLSCLILNEVNVSIQQTKIAGSTAVVSEMSQKEIACDRKQAEEYNQRLARLRKKQPFAYRGSENTDPEYDSILALGPDGIMGSVSIPRIGIMLPIGHGTGGEILSYASGHLYGTSLPVGGSSSHCVLSAHTGLRSAKLFTDLDKVREGDHFYLTVLGDQRRYTVDRILVVLPEEADRYLQIEEGRDLVTLYTCTPYGINDHRLLVRGYYDPAAGKGAESNQRSMELTGSTLPLLKAILLSFIPVGLSVTGIIQALKRKRMLRNERNQ